MKNKIKFLLLITLITFFFANQTFASFRLAVDINQIYRNEALTLIANKNLRAEGIFGVTRWSRLPDNSNGLNPSEWIQLINSIGAYRVISEDVLGYTPGTPEADEWHFWVNQVGIIPNHAVVYTEGGGNMAGIPGFDWSYGGVWDTVLDLGVIDYTAPSHGNKIVLISRSYKDYPTRPWKTHLNTSLNHSKVFGVTFEIITDTDYVNKHNIARGIKEVLRSGKTCYLLLSPGSASSTTYARRVRSVIQNLKNKGVPFSNPNLWVVPAAYHRDYSGVGLLKSTHGGNSVEASLNWLKKFRKKL